MKMKLDERQERDLLKTEHVGFQIMLYVSVIVIVIQVVFMRASFQQLVGENVILLCGGIWAIWESMKNGLWTYDNSEPSVKSNVIFSIIASLIATFLFVLAIYVRGGGSVLKVTTIGGFFSGIFILGFVVLSLLGHSTKSKKRKLENEYKDI